MLDFEISKVRMSNEWRWVRRRWTNGTSWIRPYWHPMLEYLAVSDGLRTFVAVRERSAKSPASVSNNPILVTGDIYQAKRYEVLNWPLEFMLIESFENGSYHLHAGHWGTAPVYVHASESGLFGTWWLPNLKKHMKLANVDEVAVTRILTSRHRYSRSTLFNDIQLLTERSWAEYRPDHGLKIRYPDPAPRAQPREIKSGVDIVKVYEEELERAVTAWPYDADRTAIELSGGMDSSSVAMTLGKLGHDSLLAYALIYAGPIGEQQIQRRQFMIDKYGFKDLQVPAMDAPPLHPMGGRAKCEPIYPMDEAYHEAVENLFQLASKHGVTTFFTGDGGDELLSLRGQEWAQLGKIRGRHNHLKNAPSWLTPRTVDLIPRIEEDLAPTSIINEASLLGFASRSPQALAAGMWPLSPLCSTRMIRFCEQLPVHWRDNKRIIRERMWRADFPEEVINPKLRENFTHVMEYGLAMYGVAKVAETIGDSILVNEGYVNPDRLREAAQRTADGKDADRSIFQYLRLELGLRGLLG